jgi:ferric-dicitrate binding protein FerR (iron transport regulator)
MNDNQIIESTDRFDQLIVKYLNGSADNEEVRELESLVQASCENRDYFNKLRNIWESSTRLPVTSESALKTVLGKIRHTTFRKRFFTTLQKVAAVLLIPLLFSTAWLVYDNYIKRDDTFISNKSLSAAFGTIATIDLPDGTKVWLNSGSSISYPESFTDNVRSVNLTGEAYFEVKSDQYHPFYVKTDGLVVKATGTKFSVMAYEKSAIRSVALAEGKVAVKTVDSRKMEQILYLKPSQSLRFDRTNGRAEVSKEDIYKHFAWKDGKMVFRNDPLSEVASRISLQYNVDVEVRGEQVRQYRYYATFQNESLREVFDLLKISSPFDYRIENQKVLPDGTFSRKKIIIYPINKKTN